MSKTIFDQNDLENLKTRKIRAKEFAEKYGMTRSYIYKRIKEYGIRLTGLCSKIEIEKNDLKGLERGTIKAKELATKYHVSYYTMLSMVKRYNIKVKTCHRVSLIDKFKEAGPRKYSYARLIRASQRYQEMHKCYKELGTLEKVGEKFGVTKQMVSINLQKRDELIAAGFLNPDF